MNAAFPTVARNTSVFPPIGNWHTDNGERYTLDPMPIIGDMMARMRAAEEEVRLDVVVQYLRSIGYVVTPPTTTTKETT